MLILSTRGEVLQLAYSPDGTRLAAWGRTSEAPAHVTWWDLGTGKNLRPTQLSGWPEHVVIASQADTIAYLTGTGVYLIRADDTFIGRGDAGVDRRVTFAMTPDAALLAASSIIERQPLQRSLIEVFDPKQLLTPIHRFKSSLRVSTLTFDSGGRLLASGGEGGFTIWDLERGESIGAFYALHARRIAFAPSGPTFASLHDYTLALHSHPHVKPIWEELRSEAERFVDVAFHPDGRILAAAGSSGLIEFRAAADGRLAATFDWGIGPLRCVAFSPDGLTCAAGSADGRIVVWDLDDN